MTDTACTPSIPPTVRTVVYFVGLAVGFFGLLATGITAAVWPDYAGMVATVVAAVTGACGWLSSALGVAFRPTVSPPQV